MWRINARLRIKKNDGQAYAYQSLVQEFGRALLSWAQEPLDDFNMTVELPDGAYVDEDVASGGDEGDWEDFEMFWALSFISMCRVVSSHVIVYLRKSMSLFR